MNVAGIEETVTDKGYHSGAVVKRMKAYGVRSYIPEKKQKGRRNWAGKAAEQQAVYANRRRVRGEYGKSLLRRRGELVERSFAHCYETGGMRRCHLRGRDNILKRQLVHVGAFNLSLILRQLLGAGTPRELRNRLGRLVVRVLLLFSNRNSQHRLRCHCISGSVAKCAARSRTRIRRPLCRKSATCTRAAKLPDLVRLAKHRWIIERDYEELKQELGLGHYEGRGWRGFHHHATLCIAAYGFLVAERSRFSPSARAGEMDLPVSKMPPKLRPRGSPATRGAA